MTVQQTSIDAFEEIKPELGERQLSVYNALNGEMNNSMIARTLNIPINTVTPRVKELRNMGLVIESKRDECPITHRTTIFWRKK